MVREEQLIERIGRKLPIHGHGLRAGIGDDAAVLRLGSRFEWVVTTDAFLENVHFLRGVDPPKAAGHKAIARATSDIAAMGARARYFFLTLGLPETCAGAWLDAFLDGMARAARRYGLALAGGDTTKFESVIASLTVMGEIEPGRAVLRSGAKPGDLLCVSGRLGEAQLGLELVLRKLHRRRRWATLLRKHFWPEPRLALGQWLGGKRVATSMIDTSDGLSTDLGHLCQASGVGARVWAEKIPVVHVPPELQRMGFDGQRMALHGGEDYELLFTVPKRHSNRLPRRIAGIPLTVIGEITREKRVTLVGLDGRAASFKPEGWDSFRKKV
jgi:thiamine-monophosphate kinase